MVTRMAYASSCACSCSSSRAFAYAGGGVMTWFKVDDKFYDHPKVIASGATAVGVWLMCGTWAAAHLTDGYVPNEIVRRFIPRTVKNANIRQKLIDNGLWEDGGDGVWFRDWTEYQPSRAKVEAKRQASRERQERHRAEARRGTEEGPKRDRRGTQEGQKRDTLFDVPAGESKKTKERHGVTARVPTRPVKEQETSSLVPATSSRGLAVVPDPEEPNAGTLVAAWIDHRGGVAPAPRILGQVSRELRQLLDAKIAPRIIYEGLINWQESGYAPSALSSFVDRALVQPSGVNSPKKIGSRTDQMLTESVDTLAWAREMDRERQARGELA
jgi:hypothetical protein